MRKALTDAVITVPDGMPIVWAANMLGEDLPNRVYGPELMRRYCERSVERGHRVWLYGGRDQGALVQLALTLRKKHPGIQIVGGYSPPFRPLTEEEDETIAAADQRGPARRAVGGHRRAQAGEVDGADARPPRRARDVRRRRRVRLPRRPRVAGAALDAGARAWSGPTGSPRSRAGCCRATSTPTRASCSASCASTSPSAAPAGPRAAPVDCARVLARARQAGSSARRRAGDRRRRLRRRPSARARSRAAPTPWPPRRAPSST